MSATTFSRPTLELIDTLVQRAKLVEMPRFLVSFDYVESFSGGALVLRGQDGVAGLEMLHVQLGDCTWKRKCEAGRLGVHTARDAAAGTGGSCPRRPWYRSSGP